MTNIVPFSKCLLYDRSVEKKEQKRHTQNDKGVKTQEQLTREQVPNIREVKGGKILP